jgi:hypothetical protein
MSRVAGQNDLALKIQGVRNPEPAVHDGLTGFEQFLPHRAECDSARPSCARTATPCFSTVSSSIVSGGLAATGARTSAARYVEDRMPRWAARRLRVRRSPECSRIVIRSVAGSRSDSVGAVPLRMAGFPLGRGDLPHSSISTAPLQALSRDLGTVRRLFGSGTDRNSDHRHNCAYRATL